MSSNQAKTERPHPLAVIAAARKLGIDSVAVATSCGKDSVATLDLCCRHFSRVHAYFMYFVRGLSFQERYLSYLEKRYGISIARVPHFNLSRLYRNGALRHPTKRSAEVKLLRMPDVEAAMRRRFNVEYVATGERRGDSIERNTQIVQSDGGISVSRHRIWPIGYWTKGQVESYLANAGVMMPPDYRLNLESRRSGVSFGNMLRSPELIPIRDNYPDDYEKICRQFPLAAAQVQRFEQRNSRGIVDGQKEQR